MTVLFSILSLILITVHLSACKKNQTVLRKITKPFLVPMMTLVWLSTIDRSGLNAEYSKTIIIAMVFYTLGDILLIPSERIGMFLLGMLSFILGHIVITWSFATSGIYLKLFAAASIVWLSVLVFLFLPKLDRENRMTPFITIYAIMITAYGIILSSYSYAGNIKAHITAVLGVSMFAFSDSIIAVGIMNRKENHTLVMSTYIAAVGLLLLSAYMQCA